MVERKASHPALGFEGLPPFFTCSPEKAMSRTKRHVFVLQDISRLLGFAEFSTTLIVSGKRYLPKNNTIKKVSDIDSKW